jgi:hypothetical protein
MRSEREEAVEPERSEPPDWVCIVPEEPELPPLTPALDPVLLEVAPVPEPELLGLVEVWA